MDVSTKKQLVNMKHFFLVLSRLWQVKDYMALSQFKWLFGQSNTVSRATCCPRTTFTAGLILIVMVGTDGRTDKRTSAPHKDL